VLIPHAGLGHLQRGLKGGLDRLGGQIVRNADIAIPRRMRVPVIHARPHLVPRPKKDPLTAKGGFGIDTAGYGGLLSSDPPYLVVAPEMRNKLGGFGSDHALDALSGHVAGEAMQTLTHPPIRLVVALEVTARHDAAGVAATPRTAQLGAGAAHLGGSGRGIQWVGLVIDPDESLNGAV
jgi:hypothetical protein